MYIAHIRQVDGEKQALRDHLNETALISGSNGKILNLEATCYLAGLVHDCGKYTSLFQNYLIEAIQHPEQVTPGSVDHSTYGGKILWKLTQSPYEKLSVEMIANAVFSHHSRSGLIDFIEGDMEKEITSPFINRLEKELPEFQEVKEKFFEEIISETELEDLVRKSGKEIAKILNTPQKTKETDWFFYTKFIYSCLLDADRTNTRNFEINVKEEEINTKKIFLKSQEKLEEKFSYFEKQLDENKDRNTHANEINLLRQKMANACLERSKDETGIYHLSIPTGGGKTLSSLRYALNHSLYWGKQKIIYILPFTTIIEQNAVEVRKILQNNEIVLEHHSNINLNSENSEEEEKRQALLQDNWDSPIIFTTMVRFLEVTFAGGTRNPRRFHQLINSVLIFDEVQAIPLNCITMFIRLIEFLRDYGKTTSILCTATQPAFEKLKVSLHLKDNYELISNLEEVSEQFKRVEIFDKTTNAGYSSEEIKDLVLEILRTKNSVLIILNTKKAVRETYLAVKDIAQVSAYHLSTNMCSQHRKNIIDELREQLKNPGDNKIVCVATPLIEAGIDISFNSVIRGITGLDSIAQACGRCNRNGESDVPQPVYLINVLNEDRSLKSLPQIQKGKEVTEQLLFDIENPSSLLQPKMMERYFTRYYKIMDKNNNFNYPFGREKNQFLAHLMSANSNRVKSFKKKYREKNFILSQSFATIARNFRVIDSNTTPVLVPYKDEGKKVIAEFNGEIDTREMGYWYKESQKFTLNLYSQNIDQLGKAHLIYPLLNGEMYALAESAYDEEFGLNLSGESTFQSLLF